MDHNLPVLLPLSNSQAWHEERELKPTQSQVFGFEADEKAGMLEVDTKTCSGDLKCSINILIGAHREQTPCSWRQNLHSGTRAES